VASGSAHAASATGSTKRRGIATRRRAAVVAANRAARVLERLGVPIVSFDEERVRAAAVREAGSDDFGTDEYREPLGVLFDSLAGEARLNLLGRFTARSQLVTLLANRARMQQWWARHPEIRRRPVLAPWFVVGLPRSGTTLMQQLLALDGANRTLRFWEATRPAPPPDPVTEGTDGRIAAARRAQRLLDYVAPDANAIHPVGAEAPTECVSLLAHSFASLEFGVINHVPGHVRWCLQADLHPHYEYFHRQLQLLQWRYPPLRWVLKSPAHLVALEPLLEVFPDASVIWLHRDPVAAVTSHCSLVAVLQAIGTDHVDLHAIGQEWPRTWAEVLDRALAARDRLGHGRIVDVDYGAFAADPVAAVRHVYDRLGAALGDEAEGRMHEFVARHPRGARGEHVYAPSDFDRSTEELRDLFSAYSARFVRNRRAAGG
jgi:hypothetical protein